MKGPKCKFCGLEHFGLCAPARQAVATRVNAINQKTAAAVPPEKAAARRQEKLDPAPRKARKAKPAPKRKPASAKSITPA